MTTETLEELRQRLLRQDSVQQMIQVRAFEIYQMRGGNPGGEAQDWFHAESEVLAFLLADESTRDDGYAGSAPAEAPVGRKPKSRARAKTGEAKAEAPRKPAGKRTPTKKPSRSKSTSTRVTRKSKPDGG